LKAIAPWAIDIVAFQVLYSLPLNPLEMTTRSYLESLNRVAQERGLVNAQGCAIRFADASELTEQPYEGVIFETGLVPTRTVAQGFSEVDMWHDYFNASKWLQWPQVKRAINAQQYAEQHRASPTPDVAGQAYKQAASQRGVTRDRLTLVDESGVVVKASVFMAELFKQRLWKELFWVNRSRILAGDFQVFVLGHGLQQRLQNPFKSITAHAWVFPLEGEPDSLLEAVIPNLQKSQPLPLMGLPGWHETWSGAAQDEAFYNDLNVFRP
jgi:Protein of unknown function (DUF3025)